LKAVVSGLPHTTSSLREGQLISAKRPSSSKRRLFARFKCRRLENGIGGLYLSPEGQKKQLIILHDVPVVMLV